MPNIDDPNVIIFVRWNVYGDLRVKENVTV